MLDKCGNGWGALIALLWTIHALIDYWLGRTNKTKSASLLELVLTMIAMVVIGLLKRKKEFPHE